MMVYAGIDEAGYGPLLGPLVIARAVFLIRDGARSFPGPAPPCLWAMLSPHVSRRPREREGALAVADSKRLYNRSAGLRYLEAGVLGFLGTAGIRPTCLEEVLSSLAADEDSRRTDLPWYADSGGGPSLPSALSRDGLEAQLGRLRAALAGAGVRLADLKAAVLFEDRFNRLVRQLESKARCAWLFVSLHLRQIWDRFGRQGPLVVIDRQGGRKDYADGLKAEFGQNRVEVVAQGERTSRYRIADGERRMEVVLQVRSEADHLPVALASMTSKYVRELLMGRLRRYWRANAPEVEPTAGYYGDGRRFLRQIAPHLDRMGVDPSTLVRVR